MKYQTAIDFGFNNTMSLIIGEIDKNSTILEFGPASGRLTKYLREHYGCHMYIVELDSEAGAIAAQYSEDAVIGDIQDYEWEKKFAGIQFDYILFADVLEHLYSPKEVLKKASAFLKENGKLIFSVPNIAHNSIIIDLLKNKFDYQPTGLLDNTHIRFWTKDIIEDTLKECELYTQKRLATYTQVGHNEFDNTYDDLDKIGINSKILKQRKYGELYQYIYVTSKNKKEAVEDLIEPYTEYFYLQYYDENKAKRKFIKGDQNYIKLNIELQAEQEKLRLDPINASSIVKLINIEGYTDSGEKKQLKIESSNAFLFENNIFYFLEEDAEIFIFTFNCKKIVIEYKIIDFGTIPNLEFMLDSIKQKKDIIEQKQNYIEELQHKYQKDSNTYQEQIKGYTDELEKLKNEGIIDFFKRKFHKYRYEGK